MLKEDVKRLEGEKEAVIRDLKRERDDKKRLSNQSIKHDIAVKAIINTLHTQIETQIEKKTTRGLRKSQSLSSLKSTRPRTVVLGSGRVHSRPKSAARRTVPTHSGMGRRTVADALSANPLAPPGSSGARKGRP